MKSIRIQNLKSIIDSGDIDLKNMTVVIGKNSSGKSTLLRAFPLLKQSIAKRLSSPILWYGDYVDFGSYQKALTKDLEDADKGIAFHFVFDNVPFSERDKLNFIEVSLDLKLNDKDIVYYHIEVPNCGSISFTLDSGAYKLSIDGRPCELVTYSPSIESSFFPVRKRAETYSRYSHFSYYLDDYYFVGDEYYFGAPAIRKEMIDFIFDEKELNRLASKLYKRKTRDSSNKDKVNTTKEEIAANYLGIAIDSLLSGVDRAFRRAFESVQYFEPLRSRGDRFYRVQGLNVNEIDSNGNNAPMILYKMNKKERVSFKKWCLDNLGFYYDTVDIGDGDESTSVFAHCDSNSDSFNMTDVGFGYSQIFPIILSIWMSFFSDAETQTIKTIVIEQPELHLHPAFQKKIIKTFLKLIELSKNNKKDLKFIIETHSETIVNYLGKLIYNKSVSKDDINLLVCEKVDNKSTFERMIFNDEGYIENWPIGFFSDEE